MSYEASGKKRSRYIDLKYNGKLFPTWVLANFKKYKLPEIITSKDDDPCAREEKNEIRKYQAFASAYLDFNSPYQDILLYHGLGSGKTASTINIYNMLYNYTGGWNVFVLLKATLLEHPWMSDIKKFMLKDEYEFRFKNIRFISYDAPNADKQFMEAVRNADSSKKNVYIIEEAHNFIRNVYSNISTRQGKRAQSIYDHMIQDKKENEGVRVILLTGTPAVNKPFELALLFNLLRPGAFPKSEVEFNQLYVQTGVFETLHPARKNTFQRRIMGLVSYYIGSTPDLYASSKTQYIDVEMADYQQDIYKFYEELEEQMARKKKAGASGGSETYKSYTRQSSNFVFPPLAQGVSGETRPRPNKFRITEKDAQKLLEARDPLKGDDKKKDKGVNVSEYAKALETFVRYFDDFIDNKARIDNGKNYTIMDDFKKYNEKYNQNFKEFVDKEKDKSNVFNALHMCSAKYVNAIFNILNSPGPVLVYSNYVYMEGLQVFKIYLKYFGFSSFDNKNEGKDFFKYMEYHGGIEKSQRGLNLVNFNNKENIYGKLCKIIMISPAGAEGLSLRNTRQVHILEPYWQEVRIIQMIGRALRAKSHCELPLQERHVDIFRYKSIRKAGGKQTTDQYIEELARSKEGLIQSFLDAIKEVAIDCNLFKAHNMMEQDYKCFQFEEPSLFESHIGPAYKEDIADDLFYNSGSNSLTSQTIRVKLIKINAVKALSPDPEKPSYSKAMEYWYNPVAHTVYDYEMHYPYGKVAVDDNNLPIKLDKNTYIIDRVIPIPMIEEV